MLVRPVSQLAAQLLFSFATVYGRLKRSFDRHRVTSDDDVVVVVVRTALQIHHQSYVMSPTHAQQPELYFHSRCEKTTRGVQIPRSSIRYRSL